MIPLALSIMSGNRSDGTGLPDVLTTYLAQASLPLMQNASFISAAAAGMLSILSPKNWHFGVFSHSAIGIPPSSSRTVENSILDVRARVNREIFRVNK
jgi:hypothetical protein